MEMEIIQEIDNDPQVQAGRISFSRWVEEACRAKLSSLKHMAVAEDLPGKATPGLRRPGHSPSPAEPVKYKAAGRQKK